MGQPCLRFRSRSHHDDPETRPLLIRTLLWIGLAVAAVAAAWIVLGPTPVEAIEQFDATTPWVLGNSEDGFDYAGETIRILEGLVQLLVDPETINGSLEITLKPDAALDVILSGQSSKRDITLRLDLRHAIAVWSHRQVHGDTGIGDNRLPGTFARYAGSGDFELLIDGVRQITEWRGIWSIAQALRQSDGTIRDQGLVFSPLLRDRSGFSDPERTEFTLLIYRSLESSDDIVLHLVFPMSSDPIEIKSP